MKFIAMKSNKCVIFLPFLFSPLDLKTHCTAAHAQAEKGGHAGCCSHSTHSAPSCAANGRRQQAHKLSTKTPAKVDTVLAQAVRKAQREARLMSCNEPMFECYSQGVFLMELSAQAVSPLHARQPWENVLVLAPV